MNSFVIHSYLIGDPWMATDVLIIACIMIAIVAIATEACERVWPDLERRLVDAFNSRIGEPVARLMR